MAGCRIYHYFVTTSLCHYVLVTTSRNLKMSVVITEKAASEVKRIIEDQKLEEGTVLRIGVAGGGCSGFSYSLGFDKNFDEKADAKYEYHGVPVSTFSTGSKNGVSRSTTLTPSNRAVAVARSKPKGQQNVSSQLVADEKRLQNCSSQPP